MPTTFQMGNASDTSDVFASTISKEYDNLMGSLYSAFCEWTQRANLCVIPAGAQSAAQLTLFLLLLCTGILSLMGNCILLLVAYHKRSTLKPAEFFIINLSISDLGMTLSLFPLAIPSAFSHRCLIFHSSFHFSHLRNIKLIPLWNFFDCNLQLFWRFRSFLSCSCYPVSPLCIFVIWISLDFWLLVGQNKPPEEFTLSLRNFLAAYRQNKESNNQEMSLFSLCTGGCLERSPVSSMLCVEYCLVYAAWPTSQLSP